MQVFYPCGSPRTEPILAVVGELQFEVAKYRLESEYKVKTVFSTLPFTRSRVTSQGDRDRDRSRAQLPSNAKLVEDWDGRPAALFESEWSLRLAQEWNPELDVRSHSPRRCDEGGGRFVTLARTLRAAAAAGGVGGLLVPKSHTSAKPTASRGP